jgi:predicted ArsR family transcriptional regulator
MNRRNYPLGPCQEDILGFLADKGTCTIQQISDGIGQISRATDAARTCRRSIKKLVHMGYVTETRGHSDGERGRPRARYDITTQGLLYVEEAGL